MLIWFVPRFCVLRLSLLISKNFPTWMCLRATCQVTCLQAHVLQEKVKGVKGPRRSKAQRVWATAWYSMVEHGTSVLARSIRSLLSHPTPPHPPSGARSYPLFGAQSEPMVLKVIRCSKLSTFRCSK